jgi:hypothetical protein
MAKHMVVIKNADGTPSPHSMKEWLRQNPQHIPEGFGPDQNTSHELRRALQRNGWKIKELSDQVLIIQPDEKGDTSYTDILIEGIAAIAESLEDDKIVENAEEITFGLERDLQCALRAKIEQLESGLRIIDSGKERITDAGRIDITAADSKDNIVILELKAGTALPEVITQVLAYMGTVAESDKKPVRGIIIAGGFHKRVIQAARAIPNLQLRKYSFQFTFESVK